MSLADTDGCHAPVSKRLQAELDLLDAMYPDSIAFDMKSFELTFKPGDSQGTRLVLRLPHSYPESGIPDVIVATGSGKIDLRQKASAACRKVCEEQGEGEVLDAVISRFLEIADQDVDSCADAGKQDSPKQDMRKHSKTVIIWLHHLLATSKRKLALHPTLSSLGPISGITKPGYPGVMVFTGPKEAVDEHVAELKALNWQAFSVRYEEDEKWVIGGGKENVIYEVESMSEVVQMVEDGNREVFLRAVGVK